jgi:hypothetical protein
VRQKLAFRGKPFAGIQAAVVGKEARLRMLWATRLAQQVSHLREFDEVFRFGPTHLSTGGDAKPKEIDSMRFLHSKCVLGLWSDAVV